MSAAGAPPVAWWRRPRVIEAIGTAAFSIYVAWPFLSLTQYVTTYDTVTYAGPHLSYTFDQWRAGRIPVWNDSIFNGVPHLANAQTAPFNPVKLLFLPFEAGRAMQLITATNILVLAAGTLFLLSRRLELSPPAGFVGTVAVVGGGLVMVRSTQFEQMSVVAWLPWLLAAVDWAASQPRSRPRAIAGVAITTGLMLVAGHPNQVYVCLPLVAVWSVVRVADQSSRWRSGATPGGSALTGTGERAPDDPLTLRTVATDLVRGFGTLALGALLGAGLAAPQLLPLAAQLGASVNSSGRPLLATNNPELILTPNFIPSALVGQTWSPTPATSSGSFEAAGFVGVTVCILALLGVGVLATRRGGRWTGLGLGGIAVVGVVLAVGSECHIDEQSQRVCEPGGKLFRFMFENMPGFDQARVPGRWILLTSVALAILAAFAIDALARKAVTTSGLTVGGALLATCLVAMLLTPLEHNDDIGPSYTVWVVAGGLTLLAVVAGYAAGRHPTERRPKATTRAARYRGRPAIAVGAVGLLVVLITLELGAAQRYSAARQSLVGSSFTEMGGTTAEFLRRQPERNLSLGGTPAGDYPYLSNSLRPNANLTFGSRSLDGYDGGLWVTQRWVTAVDPLTKEIFNNDLPLTWQIEVPPNRELLARFGVKYIIVDAKGTAEVYGLPDPTSTKSQADAARIVAQGYRGPVLIDGPLQVFENPSYASDALVYFNTVEVPQDPDTIIRRLGGVRPDQALVPEGSISLRCDGACPAQPVKLERPRPGEMRATVDLKRKGLLVVAEQGATGWTATVDGTAAPIIPVDSVSQGIVLEPGQHTIELSYAAPGLRSGLAMAALSILAVIACVWAPRWLRLPRRRGRSAPSRTVGADEPAIGEPAIDEPAIDETVDVIRGL